MKYQKAFLAKFPDQIEFALNNYDRHNLSIDQFSHVVIGGLGGSGIAGRIAKSYFHGTSPVPIEIVSDYNLPAYVGEKSLVILSSYSGNTEETLSLYISAIEKHATVLVITTGGLLQELALEANIQIFEAEKGFQPRMALGYSLTFLVLIFSELLKQSLHNNIRSLMMHLKETDVFITRAEKLFAKFKLDFESGKCVINTDPAAFPIGLRFAQQLQENAKCEAFVHELPEANHNVIESYYGELNSNFVFIDSCENQKVCNRFAFVKGLLQKNNNNVIDVNLLGFTLRDLYEIIYTLDWVSLMIADAKGVKSDDIANINALKEYLSTKS
ncbi:MAG: SIS domain-containing protein [Bacteroidetes bacterium]|jgi:glucose/mannose-6-phosphate isomerase|nr:SIS domain-containing protein [Bacteroidota bacterium]MBT5530142.1 SIS domain-containing protein [Cytophagia bacterium]MBT3421375.1 SIS domain-containing protein [Bacteroidota bacterium]MBT3799886.1 SIS domain-containing protein [Bacteroidota bacterium]MBT3933575.1 SIS domain-containing protein [Bacteroidota bacterium]